MIVPGKQVLAILLPAMFSTSMDLQAGEPVCADCVTFTYKNIEGLEIRADAYLPAEAKNFPVAVYVHGGGLMFVNLIQARCDVYVIMKAKELFYCY